jgi:hypothetical protein
MNALGFTEWKDGFNLDNIPSTKLEKAYHIETRTASVTGWSQTDLTVSQRVRIQAFRKGYGCAADAIDNVLLDADSIVNKMITPTIRLTTNIKNIRLLQMDIEPIDATNDNAAMMSLDFDCTIMFNGG